MKMVLDVGQCAVDHRSMRKVVESLDAKVRRVHLPKEAIEILEKEPVDLVLVNRIIDRDGSEGIDLIREIRSRQTTRAVPVMLISDFSEAQKAAVDAGAVLGFGKKDLKEGKTRELLAQYLQ